MLGILKIIYLKDLGKKYVQMNIYMKEIIKMVRKMGMGK